MGPGPALHPPRREHPRQVRLRHHPGHPVHARPGLSRPVPVLRHGGVLPRLRRQRLHIAAVSCALRRRAGGAAVPAAATARHDGRVHRGGAPRHLAHAALFQPLRPQRHLHRLLHPGAGDSDLALPLGAAQRLADRDRAAAGAQLRRERGHLHHRRHPARLPEHPGGERLGGPTPRLAEDERPGDARGIRRHPALRVGHRRALAAAGGLSPALDAL